MFSKHFWFTEVQPKQSIKRWRSALQCAELGRKWKPKSNFWVIEEARKCFAISNKVTKDWISRWSSRKPNKIIKKRRRRSATANHQAKRSRQTANAETDEHCSTEHHSTEHHSTEHCSTEHQSKSGWKAGISKTQHNCSPRPQPSDWKEGVLYLINGKQHWICSQCKFLLTKQNTKSAPHPSFWESSLPIKDALNKERQRTESEGTVKGWKEEVHQSRKQQFHTHIKTQFKIKNQMIFHSFLTKPNQLANIL